MKINLTTIPVFLITCNSSKYVERCNRVEKMLKDLGFLFVTKVIGAVSTPYYVSLRETIMTLMINQMAPFIIIEDDAMVTETFKPILELPETIKTDVLYLGGMRAGNMLEKPNDKEIETNPENNMNNKGSLYYKKINSDFVRIYNMYSAHAILFLTEEGKNLYLRYTNSYSDKVHDIAFSWAMPHVNTLMVREPFFYQDDKKYIEQTKKIIYEEDTKGTDGGDGTKQDSSEIKDRVVKPKAPRKRTPKDPKDK